MNIHAVLNVHWYKIPPLMKLRLLYLLQLLDSKLAAFERQRRELLAPTEIQKRHGAVLVEIEQQNAVLHATRQTLKDKQLALKSLEDKINLNQKKLMSGKVTNPRELADLENFINALKRDQGEQDETLLTLMDQESAEMQALTVLQGREKHAAREMAEEQEEINRELAALDDLTFRVKDRREEVLCGVDEEQLGLYKTLSARKAGLAVSAVRNGSGGECCGGCGMTLPDMELDAVRQDEDIVHCSNCDRILVWDEENLAGRLLEI